MCKTPRMRSGSTERNKELIEGCRGLGAQGWDLGLGLGRKCAWQSWRERPFRGGGGGSGVGAALEQKPGRELSGAKRRRDLDFTPLTSASNRMSTFHTRGQIHNLEVTSTQNINLWEMFHKVIWFVQWEFANFSDDRVPLRIRKAHVELRKLLCVCVNSGAIATCPASIRTSWLRVSSQ